MPKRPLYKEKMWAVISNGLRYTNLFETRNTAIAQFKGNNPQQPWKKYRKAGTCCAYLQVTEIRPRKSSDSRPRKRGKK